MERGECHGSHLHRCRGPDFWRRVHRPGRPAGRRRGDISRGMAEAEIAGARFTWAEWPLPETVAPPRGRSCAWLPEAGPPPSRSRFAALRAGGLFVFSRRHGRMNPDTSKADRSSGEGVSVRCPSRPRTCFSGTFRMRSPRDRRGLRRAPLSRDAVVFHEGADADALFIVKTGIVKLLAFRRTARRPPCTSCARDVFGELAVTEPVRPSRPSR